MTWQDALSELVLWRPPSDRTTLHTAWKGLALTHLIRAARYLDARPEVWTRFAACLARDGLGAGRKLRHHHVMAALDAITAIRQGGEQPHPVLGKDTEAMRAHFHKVFRCPTEDELIAAAVQRRLAG